MDTQSDDIKQHVLRLRLNNVCSQTTTSAEYKRAFPWLFLESTWFVTQCHAASRTPAGPQPDPSRLVTCHNKQGSRSGWGGAPCLLRAASTALHPQPTTAHPRHSTHSSSGLNKPTVVKRKVLRYDTRRLCDASEGLCMVPNDCTAVEL